MVSAAGVARSNATCWAYEVSRRPWPVPRRDSAAAGAPAASRRDSTFARGSAIGCGAFLRRKSGDADHADAVGPAGARGIRVGQRREIEGGRLGEALPPAEDVVRLAGG